MRIEIDNMHVRSLRSSDYSLARIDMHMFLVSCCRLLCWTDVSCPVLLYCTFDKVGTQKKGDTMSITSIVGVGDLQMSATMSQSKLQSPKTQ
jgi:hypothetical protein